MSKFTPEEEEKIEKAIKEHKARIREDEIQAEINSRIYDINNGKVSR